MKPRRLSFVHLRHPGLAIFLALSACQSQAEPGGEPAKAERGSGSAALTDGQQAKILVQHGATLVDVRTPSEYAEGHVAGAKNIPLSDLAQHLGEIDKDHAVVVYCHSGRRSAKAAKLLAAEGFEVHDLGGMNNWEK